MVKLIVKINKFEKKGDKTGWTYIVIPLEASEKIFPGNKKSFRVKGKFDDYKVKQVAVLPDGNGNFIIALNAKMRKGIGKKVGDELTLMIERDMSALPVSTELLDCLTEEPEALETFKQLAPSHQRYFHNWINEAKTFETKAKRIALTVNAMLRNFSFSDMIRNSRSS